MQRSVTGEVDVITDAPPDQLDPIEGRGEFAVRAGEPVRFLGLYYNTQAPPLDRQEIRQALNIAIDRKALAEKQFRGYAEVPRGFQGARNAYYDDERAPLPFEPGRARELLRKGGYAGEETIYVAASPDYFPLDRVRAEAVVGMWKDVGVNARLELREQGRIEGSFYREGNTEDHAIADAGGFVGDPQFFFERVLGPEGYYQGAGLWSRADLGNFNDLLDRLAATFDQGERAALYRRMLDELEEVAIGTPLIVDQPIFATSRSVDLDPYGVLLDLRPDTLRLTREG